MAFRLHVVMGVAGCGKSTVGQGLAAATGGTYLEGDVFHPQTNIDKMSRGEPLSDDDRWPWLDVVATQMCDRNGKVFVGCSALKKIYRDRLRAAAGEQILFIHLAGNRQLIASRMERRKGHFMPLELLNSQFTTLEPPSDDEDALSVDISLSAREIEQSILNRL